LHDWNRLAIPSIAAITQYQYVHAQIASQADSQPDAVALIFANEQLTFGQLNSQVNALAWRLHAAGAKPGCLVGLAIERNIDMVVGLLAILKSGAGYVPLDPDYPQERLAYMMADSDITLLLTQRSVVNRLPVLGELVTVFVDGDDSAKVSKDFAPVSVHPENLAYVIYTSGSTGKPKGVAMSHRALLEHTYVAIDYFELTRADRVLLFSSLNFDGFMEQLFPALCIGAGVVIRGDEVWDSETFYQEALRTGLTVADLSTAYWHMLAQDFAKVGPRDYGKLRQVNATGEAMPPQGLHAWRQAGLDKVRLFNTYGPTETTVTASHLDCQDYISGALEIPAMMPIGRGLSGRAMYILDNALEPSPLGVIGELYIGGGLLAEGYHRRQTLTAERFIADPFSQELGQRMYRTGDLARYQADGTIEYVGRIDHQVKIRGFRIELGEIESALQSSDVVRDAVVLAQESQGSKQLVAYIIPTDEALVEAESEQQHAFRAQLKEQLQTALPEYMVPAHLLLLTAFP
jgi:amino acid adenylation domain-containing protein